MVGILIQVAKNCNPDPIDFAAITSLHFCNCDPIEKVFRVGNKFLELKNFLPMALVPGNHGGNLVRQYGQYVAGEVARQGVKRFYDYIRDSAPSYVDSAARSAGRFFKKVKEGYSEKRERSVPQPMRYGRRRVFSARKRSFRRRFRSRGAFRKSPRRSFFKRKRFYRRKRMSGTTIALRTARPNYISTNHGWTVSWADFFQAWTTHYVRHTGDLVDWFQTLYGDVIANIPDTFTIYAKPALCHVTVASGCSAPVKLLFFRVTPKINSDVPYDTFASREFARTGNGGTLSPMAPSTMGSRPYMLPGIRTKFSVTFLKKVVLDHGGRAEFSFRLRGGKVLPEDLLKESANPQTTWSYIKNWSTGLLCIAETVSGPTDQVGSAVPLAGEVLIAARSNYCLKFLSKDQKTTTHITSDWNGTVKTDPVMTEFGVAQAVPNVII